MESSDDKQSWSGVCVSDCPVTEDVSSGDCYDGLLLINHYFLLSSLNSRPLLLAFVSVEEILLEPRVMKEHTSCGILEWSTSVGEINLSIHDHVSLCGCERWLEIVTLSHMA
jgi:hypothetical protein